MYSGNFYFGTKQGLVGTLEYYKLGKEYYKLGKKKNLVPCMIYLNPCSINQ